jgi:hypothetical protein
MWTLVPDPVLELPRLTRSVPAEDAVQVPAGLEAAVDGVKGCKGLSKIILLNNYISKRFFDKKTRASPSRDSLFLFSPLFSP